MSEPATKSEDKAATKPADNPFVEMIRNPAARTYLLISAGGLLVACAVLLLFQKSAVAAAVVFIFGATGLGLRWVVGPPAVVVAICYLAFFPLGLPLSLPSGNQIAGRQTDANLLFSDLLLTASAMVYLIAAYRFHAIMRAGMPFDAPAAFVKPGAKPTVRPAEPIRDAELWFLFARVGVFVLGGQLLWLCATKLKVDFRRLFPLRFFNGVSEESGFTHRPDGTPFDPEALPNYLSRFLIVAGAILGLAFVVWFVFWYWRLQVMNRDEARAACLDIEWTTNRRAYNQPEKWRGWMKQKIAGTLPKKGCGAWFLVVGLPAIMVVLVLIILGCIGAYR